MESATTELCLMEIQMQVVNEWAKFHCLINFQAKTALLAHF